MGNKKALIVASVASMIDQFNMPNIKLLQELGYEVHVACNFLDAGSITRERSNALLQELEKNGITYHQIDFNRNPANLNKTIKAYMQLKRVMENKYDLVHSHSPIGGALARISANKYRKKGLTSIYTAHGFHFYKGAAFKNWLIFYPIEKLLSRLTDVLITINKEDFKLAKEKLNAKQIEIIPGVGLNFKNIYSLNKEAKNSLRISKKIDVKDFVILSLGELNNNKNHIVIIDALKELKEEDRIHNFKFIIGGKGDNHRKLSKVINEQNLQEQVFIEGYIDDVNNFLNLGDLFVFPSKREGLGMAALEAMAAGLPLITSNIHGILDYSKDGISGYLCSPTDVECFKNKIEKIYLNMEDRMFFSRNNKESVKGFSLENSINKTKNIYLGVSNE